MVGLAPDCKVLTASIGMTEQLLSRIQQEFLKNNPNATSSELEAEVKNMQKIWKNGERNGQPILLYL